MLEKEDYLAAFKKFLEAAHIGKDSGDNTVHVMGLLNAAAIACKIGDYDLCLKVSSDAREVDEEIWTKYLEEPHMQEMLSMLSSEGAIDYR